MVGNELRGDGRGEAQRRAERLQAGVWLLAGVEMSRGECMRSVRCEEKGWEGRKDNVCEGFGLWSLHKEKPGWELFRVRAAPGRSSPPPSPPGLSQLIRHCGNGVGLCGAVRGRYRQLSTARGPPPAGTRNCTGTRTGRSASLRVVRPPAPLLHRGPGGGEGASLAPAGSELGAGCLLMQIRKFDASFVFHPCSKSKQRLGLRQRCAHWGGTALSLEGFLLDIALCRVHS